jgi:hypothetical protein
MQARRLFNPYLSNELSFLHWDGGELRDVGAQRACGITRKTISRQHAQREEPAITIEYEQHKTGLLTACERSQPTQQHNGWPGGGGECVREMMRSPGLTINTVIS